MRGCVPCDILVKWVGRPSAMNWLSVEWEEQMMRTRRANQQIPRMSLCCVPPWRESHIFTHRSCWSPGGRAVASGIRGCLETSLSKALNIYKAPDTVSQHNTQRGTAWAFVHINNIISPLFEPGCPEAFSFRIGPVHQQSWEGLRNSSELSGYCFAESDIVPCVSQVLSSKSHLKISSQICIHILVRKK